ncbi:MAG: hypothetical protein WCK26_02030 [Candidatus Saccharibacteria bacterium]
MRSNENANNSELDGRANTGINFLNKYNSLFPDELNKVKTVLIAQAKNEAEISGEKTSVESYKRLLNKYSREFDRNPAIVNEVIDIAYLGLNYDILLGSENANRLNERVNILAQRDNAQIDVWGMIIGAITNESDDQSEVVMSIYDQVDTQASDIVDEIFYDDEILEIFREDPDNPDKNADPALKKPIKTLQIRAISSALKQMIGNGIEMYSNPIDISNDKNSY